MICEVDIKNYKSVALCGFRQNGRNLLERFRRQKIEVTHIIERNYEAFQEIYKEVGIPIVGFNENLQAYLATEAIVLSGDIPEDLVCECLELSGIQIPIVKLGE